MLIFDLKLYCLSIYGYCYRLAITYVVVSHIYHLYPLFVSTNQMPACLLLPERHTHIRAVCHGNKLRKTPKKIIKETGWFGRYLLEVIKTIQRAADEEFSKSDPLMWETFLCLRNRGRFTSECCADHFCATYNWERKNRKWHTAHLSVGVVHLLPQRKQTSLCQGFWWIYQDIQSMDAVIQRKLPCALDVTCICRFICWSKQFFGVFFLLILQVPWQADCFIWW